MASRTQIRLQQLTGSVSSQGSLQSPVALGSLPADHLGDVLNKMGESIARIHGEHDFTNKEAGVFTHSQSVFEGEMRVTQAALLSGSLSVAGAAALSSTLDVTGATGLSDVLEVAGDITGSAGFILAGAADLNGALDVQGAANLQSTIAVAGNADLNGELDVQGAANLQSTLAVAGAADLNGALDVAGAVDLAAAGVLTNIRGTLSVDEAATFDNNVTITGDLTVNGTTTTVNTEEVTIADHNIVLDSNNSLSAIVDGAGFTIEGGTGDDLTFQWNSANAEMQLKLGANFADLEIKDLDAANAAFSGDVAAVSGSFSGDMTVSGDISGAAAAITGLVEAGSADIAGDLAAAAVKIDGDVAQRLYIVDADGSLKDEAKLVFDQTKLAITGDEEVSGYMRAAKIEIDSASNYIDTDVNGAILLQASGSQFIFNGFASLEVDGAGKASYKAGELEFGKFDGVTYTQMLNITGAELQVAGQKPIQFNDADEAIYSDGAKLNLKSGGQNYKLPSSGVAADYILRTDASGVLEWISADTLAGGSALKEVDTVAAAVTAGNDFPAAGTPYTAFNGKDEKVIDIYVNGQLLSSNKQSVAATYDTSAVDASINTADGKIRFAFDLEIDDVVTVIGR